MDTELFKVELYVGNIVLTTMLFDPDELGAGSDNSNPKLTLRRFGAIADRNN